MDRSLFRWINRFADHTGWAHEPARLYATTGIGLFAVLVLVAALDARRRSAVTELAWTIWTAASVFIALGIGQLIGGAVGRARPYHAMADVHVLVSRTTDVSFPSDHATVAGAVAVGLWLAHRRWGTVAVVAAIVMALDRVYVGAHYPLDVLGGLVVGGVVAAAGQFGPVALICRAISMLQRTRLRVLVASAGGSPTSAT